MRQIFLTSFNLVAILTAASTASAAELAAGAARIDLTPPTEMKASLGGYGERMSRPAEGVHDRIFAKAVVLSDGQRQYAILTADVLGFPPGFKAAVVEKLAKSLSPNPKTPTPNPSPEDGGGGLGMGADHSPEDGGAGIGSKSGWSDDQIMLLPSHSHTSIDMMAINPKNVFPIPQLGIYSEKLFRFTVERCAAAIEEAGTDLVPVVVGTATTQLDGWNRNRRRGETRVDNDLTVTRIDTAGGEPLAVLVNFTAHPTIMGAEHMLFSAGWPGHLQRSLESIINAESKRLSKRPKAPTPNRSPASRSRLPDGTSGAVVEQPLVAGKTDEIGRPVQGPARQAEPTSEDGGGGPKGVTVLYFNGAQGDQSVVGRPNSGPSRWEAAETYGRELAVEALTVWRDAKTSRDVAFDYHLQTFDLPPNSWHPGFMKTGGKEYGLSQTILDRMLPMLFPRHTTTGSLRLGNLVIVGIPGEMTADLGLDVKARTKEITVDCHVAIGGLANEWISYILSADQYARGGYETSVSFYGAGLGKCVVEGALAGVGSMKNNRRTK